MAAQLKSYQNEKENLLALIDEESEGKTELQRQMSKLNAEIQQWKARFESEGLAKLDEIEDAKRKLFQRVQELQEQLESANGKVGSLEKIRHKLLGDLDDVQVDIERVRVIFNENDNH